VSGMGNQDAGHQAREDTCRAWPGQPLLLSLRVLVCRVMGPL
jgi:hypothetical protein